MKKLIACGCGLVATSRLFAVVPSPIDCHLFFDDTNTVQIAWNAYPGKSYVLQSTTNLVGSWSNGPTLVAVTNALTNTFAATAQAQFFKVVRLYTEGPENRSTGLWSA